LSTVLQFQGARELGRAVVDVDVVVEVERRIRAVSTRDLVEAFRAGRSV
jgi:hypothetical protein